MLTVPNYRVFFKEDSSLNKFRSKYPNGVPCKYCNKGFHEISKQPEFWFYLDENFADCQEFIELAKGAVGYYANVKSGKKDVRFFVSADKVELIVDYNEPCLTDDVLDECFLMVENASKLKNLTLQVDGNAIHLLILGIQQALFIEPQKDLSINDLILPMAVDLIERLTKDDEALKKAYLTGFPCEYIVKARELLFP